MNKWEAEDRKAKVDPMMWPFAIIGLVLPVVFVAAMVGIFLISDVM